MRYFAPVKPSPDTYCQCGEDGVVAEVGEFVFEGNKTVGIVRRYWCPGCLVEEIPDSSFFSVTRLKP